MASKPPQKFGTTTKSATIPRGLGRGLSTLLGNGDITTAASQVAPSDKREYQQIPVEWIDVGPWQPRRKFEREELTELAVSISQKGIVQPVLLRSTPNQSGRFQLVAGERRWRAAQIAQLHEIPAVIRSLTDAECYEVALIENIQRQDLSVIEEAQGYANLLENNHYTQDQLSRIIGKSRSHIANLLRLLGLPESVQVLLQNGALKMGQARPLVGHPQAELLAKTIIEKGLSARQVEALIKTVESSVTIPPKRSTKNEKSADIREIEKRAATELGLTMSIKWDEQAEAGRVQIDCQSLDQMTLILTKLGLSGES